MASEEYCPVRPFEPMSSVLVVMVWAPADKAKRASNVSEAGNVFMACLEDEDTSARSLRNQVSRCCLWILCIELVVQSADFAFRPIGTILNPLTEITDLIFG